MALTPQHSLPYPEATSDVRNGASDVQALADAVDARLGGAMFIASVASEGVANDDDDRLELSIDGTNDSDVFVSSGTNLIQYIGVPTVIATVYAQVTWSGNNAGSRKVEIWQNGVSECGQRLSPDSAEPFTQTIAWPLLLVNGDTLGLNVRQTSGASLNVTFGRFRCVVHGIPAA